MTVLEYFGIIIEKFQNEIVTLQTHNNMQIRET